LVQSSLKPDGDCYAAFSHGIRLRISEKVSCVMSPVPQRHRHRILGTTVDFTAVHLCCTALAHACHSSNIALERINPSVWPLDSCPYGMPPGTQEHHDGESVGTIAQMGCCLVFGPLKTTHCGESSSLALDCCPLCAMQRLRSWAVKMRIGRVFPMQHGFEQHA
jgi:hypothetical protein